MGSRLMSDSEKFNKVVELVNKYEDMSADDVADFMDGGEEGWDCGDDEQSEWLNTESAEKIADWVIAGQ